jgi:hypothetical protein
MDNDLHDRAAQATTRLVLGARVGGTPPVAGLRRRWTLAFLVGELVGFLPPAIAGAALSAAGVADPVLVVGLTLAGLVEGTVLGIAQSRVLARHAPAVDSRAWVVATATAAGFAWFVGMGGGAVMGSGTVPVGLGVALLVPAWAAALLSMGYLQWRVLRSGVPGSHRWVWVTSAAWLLGVMIPVGALSVAPNAWPAWAHAIVGMLAAVAMGITVGALTGRALARLIAGSRPRAVTPSRPAGPPRRVAGR